VSKPKDAKPGKMKYVHVPTWADGSLHSTVGPISLTQNPEDVDVGALVRRWLQAFVDDTWMLSRSIGHRASAVR